MFQWVIKCVKIRPEISTVNSDEPTFYQYIVKISKYSGSCNNINDPYAKICIPDVVKNMNIKVFNLMSRTNKTRYIKIHETCKCKCRCKRHCAKSVQIRSYFWSIFSCI